MDGSSPSSLTKKASKIVRFKEEVMIDQPVDQKHEEKYSPLKMFGVFEEEA